MGTRIGEMKCLNPACSCTDAAVEETGAGTWQVRCHKCALSLFAKPGTKWRRDMDALVTLDEAPAQPKATAAKTEPSAPPAPVQKPARSVFDLGQLA